MRKITLARFPIAGQLTFYLKPITMSDTVEIKRPQPYRFASATSVQRPPDSMAQHGAEESAMETEDDRQLLQHWSTEMAREPASLELNNLEDFDKAYSARRGRTQLPRGEDYSKYHWRHIKRYLPRTRWMITFLVVVVVQTLVCVALAVSIISQSDLIDWTFMSDPYVGGMPAFILLVEVLYQLFLIVDAGRRKNIVQVVGMCLNNVSMLIMAILAYLNLAKSVLVVFWNGAIAAEYLGLIATLGICSLILIMATWLGFREFEWFVCLPTLLLVLFG